MMKNTIQGSGKKDDMYQKNKQKKVGKKQNKLS